MEIAYLMLVHKNPCLLKRALRILSTGDSGFYIHVDKKTNIDDFAEVKGRNVYYAEPRIAVFWGEFTLVEATLRLIAQALESRRRYEYCVLLLGSDYPLRGGTYIENFLERRRGSEFMSLVKIPAPGYPLSKINKLRYPSGKPVIRFVSRALAKAGLAQRDHRKHLGGLEAYAGDANWALSRAACEYILEFVRGNPHVTEYFRNAFTSDEMFFHTILGNSPFRSRMQRSLAYRYWPKPGDHPEMLDESHVRFFEERDEICVDDQFGSGEVLFARKFDDGSMSLIDRIDAMIERKDRTARFSSSSLPSNSSATGESMTTRP